MAFDVRSSTTTTGTGSTITLSLPAGTAASDALLAVMVHAPGLTVTVPAGWSLALSVFSVDNILRILQYTGDPTGAPLAFTLSGSAKYAATAIAVTRDGAVGARAPTPDVSASLVVSATSAPAEPPVVTPNVSGDLVLYAVAWGRGSTFTPPGGTTEVVDINTGSTATDKTLWVGKQPNSTTAGTPTTQISVTNDNPNALPAGEYALLTVAFQSTPPPTTWVGDFETGNFSQYAWFQGAYPDRITIQTDTPRQGAKYARFTAFNDDVYPLTPNNDPRAQLVSPRYLFPGTERWIQWSTRFPASFPEVPHTGWLVFFQMHGPPYVGSPTVGFGCSGNRINLERNITYDFDTPWSAPLVRGTWQDFILHIGLAQDSTGFIELWLNGVQQVFANGHRRLYMRTVEPDQNGGCEIDPTVYLKKGMFESVTLDHDGVRFDATAPAGIEWAPATLITSTSRARVSG
jgi:hypothetical protein